MNKFLKVLLGTGLYLLNQSDQATRDMREQVSGRVGDLRDAAQQKYDIASDRVARAADALYGEDEGHAIQKTLTFVVGLGVGVAVALLFAPASGEETRAALGEKAQEIGGNLKRSVSRSGRDYTASASAAAD